MMMVMSIRMTGAPQSNWLYHRLTHTLDSCVKLPLLATLLQWFV